MSRLSIALVLLAFIVLSEAETQLHKETSGGFMPGPEVPIYVRVKRACFYWHPTHAYSGVRNPRMSPHVAFRSDQIHTGGGAIAVHAESLWLALPLRTRVELHPWHILYLLVSPLFAVFCRHVAFSNNKTTVSRANWIGINSVPNFILAFIPAQINGNTLNTMTAFAVSGQAPSPVQRISLHCADWGPPL